MTDGSSQPPTAEYGIDRPPRVIAIAFLAFVMVMGGIFIGSGLSDARWSLPAWLLGLVLWGVTGWAFWSGKVGKGRRWDGVLDALSLTGTERALDVGCGRGLVLIKLAQRLDGTPVQGIDLWRSKDQSGNTPSVAAANASVEFFQDRVEIRTGDARDLPYGDASFDLVTASLLLGSLATPADRARVLAQVRRVLAPEGRLVVVESGSAKRLTTELIDAGFTDITTSSRSFLTFPPTRSVVA